MEKGLIDQGKVEDTGTLSKNKAYKNKAYRNKAYKIKTSRDHSTSFFHNWGRLVYAFKRSMRIANCFMGIFIVFVSAFVVLGPGVLNNINTVAPAALVAFFLMAGGNILNDVFDATIDIEVHPKRAIPSGLFSKRFLGTWGIIFYLMSLYFALSINFSCFLFALVAELVLMSYELYLKRWALVGNLAIGMLIGCVFLGTAAAIGGWTELFFLGLLGALINVGREIIKDVEDMEGDADRVTLPKKIGVSASLNVARGFLVIVMVLAVFPWYPLELFGGYFYLVFIIITEAIIGYGIIISKKNPRLSQKVIKFAMLSALLAFLVGNVGRW